MQNSSHFVLTSSVKPSYWLPKAVCAARQQGHQGWGLLSQFPLFRYFPQFSALWNTCLSCSISPLYLTGVTAAQLRWHLSNINMIKRLEILLTEKSTNLALVTPTPNRHFNQQEKKRWPARDGTQAPGVLPLICCHDNPGLDFPPYFPHHIDLICLLYQTTAESPFRGEPQPLFNTGRDKMAVIFQTTFSNAFSWMKMFEFRLKFQWSLFPRIQLTIFQYWFR